MAAASGKTGSPARGLFLLPLLGGIVAAAAQPQDTLPADQRPVTSIAEGDRLTRSMAPDDEHEYALVLDPGAYRVSLDQRGLDVRIRLRLPEARLHDSPTFRDERETLLLQPAVRTRYLFTIDSAEYTGVTGSYVLGVTSLRDAASIEAYRSMSDAVSAMHGSGDPDPVAALDHYRQALALWERTAAADEQARTLLSIAQLQYWNPTGQWSWRDAADAAADAALLYRDLGLASLEANAISLQAAALIESAYEADRSSEADGMSAAAGLYDDARDLFARAAEMQEACECWYDRAQTINNIGLTWHNQSKWAEAVPYYEEAAAEFRRLEEWAAELNPLANLAVIDQDSGRLVRAAATQERLLEIMPPDREPAWRADTLDNYAMAKLILGDTDAALTSFFEALEIHEHIQDLKGQGLSLTGIGSTYRVIGETSLARDYFERALPIRRSANDGAGQVSVLRSLAEIELEAGAFESALDKLDQASRIATSPTSVMSIGLRETQAWIGTGRHARAEQVLDETRRLAESTGSIRDIADATFWTGRLAYERGDGDAALDSFRRAAEMYAAIDVRSGQADCLLELAKLSRDAGDHPAAAEHAREAIQLVEGLRTEVTNPELRAVYLGTRVEYYDVLIDTLMRSVESAQTPADREARLYRALEASERAKARSTVDLINEASVDASGSVDPELAARLDELHASLAETQFQRNRLLDAGENGSDELDRVIDGLLRIRAELDVLETETRNSNPQYALIQDPPILDAGEIRDTLGAEDVLLQYWLGDTASYLWIVGPSSIRSVSLPARESLGDVARHVHENFAAAGYDRQSADERRAMIRSLAASVLGPAEPEVAAARRVIVAADGALQYLPFAMLPRPDGRRLVESHEVVSVPSTTVISAQRALLGGRPAPEGQVALIGDPVFEPSDPRLGTPASAAISENQTRSGLDRSYARLPFSGREVARIAALVPDEQRLVATGLDAQASRIAGEQLKDYRLVHFATHGVIDAAQPVLSSLVFSMFDDTGKPVEGHFRLRDVYTMTLNADLVVLSACETALGREIRGEGLIGLTQGFLHAGSKSVIASLWQVPDRATAELMAALYRNLLANGQPPVEALRNAQLQLSADRRWRDPYFWSGFVLLGDWR